MQCPRFSPNRGLFFLEPVLISRVRHIIASRITLFLFVGAIAPNVTLADDGAAADRFEEILHNPIELRRFLYRFPKGGDLHNHLDGAIYAENYLAWAAEDGKCIDLSTYFILPPPCDAEAERPPASQIQFNADASNPIIDALSVRNYERRLVSGHDQFFSTFRRFYQASLGREGDMLAEVAARAARQNTVYLELAQSWGMVEARQLAHSDDNIDLSLPLTQLVDNDGIEKIVSDVIAMTDRAEARWREKLNCSQNNADIGCDIPVRYLAQVIRIFPREQVFAQTLLAFKLVESDSRYVGLNFAAPEDNPITLRDHTWQMELVSGLTRHIPAASDSVTLHAGELAPGLVPPEHLGRHVREAIEIANARRIGHGIDISRDTNAEELMRLMARRKIMIEINLTSNDVILGITGAQHPFDMYRDYFVPLALSTDDEGVSRIDLTHEYQRAVETYDVSYFDLKNFSRNALQYSFLPGKDLFHDTAEGRIVDECAQSVAGQLPVSGSCENFLHASEKASLQWHLERRFADFEASFE